MTNTHTKEGNHFHNVQFEENKKEESWANAKKKRREQEEEEVNPGFRVQIGRLSSRGHRGTHAHLRLNTRVSIRKSFYIDFMSH